MHCVLFVCVSVFSSYVFRSFVGSFVYAFFRVPVIRKPFTCTFFPLNNINVDTVDLKTKQKYRRRGDIQRKAHVYDNTHSDHEAIINSSWFESFFLSFPLYFHCVCGFSWMFFFIFFFQNQAACDLDYVLLPIPRKNIQFSTYRTHHLLAAIVLHLSKAVERKRKRKRNQQPTNQMRNAHEKILTGVRRSGSFLTNL